MSKRLTTRGIATAEAIRDRIPFTTSGALRGEECVSSYPYSGWLDKAEREALSTDGMAGLIDYIVWSYATPIAWHRTDGTWHIVDQKFSMTTTKHQGNLYLAAPRVSA
jgi:hypothetical protein